MQGLHVKLQDSDTLHMNVLMRDWEHSQFSLTRAIWTEVGHLTEAMLVTIDLLYNPLKGPCFRK